MRTKLLLLALVILMACKSEEVPQDPFQGGKSGEDTGVGPINPNPNPSNPSDPSDPDDKDKGDDDTKPTPVPTPPVPGHEERTILIEPELGIPADEDIPYFGFIEKIPLGQTITNRKCHAQFPNECVVNKQVSFQFALKDLNDRYSKEDWSVETVRLKAHYYSIGDKNRTEIICLVNERLCSGDAKPHGSKLPFYKALWRRPSFWRGGLGKHMMTRDFNLDLIAAKKAKGLYILKNHSYGLDKLFLLGIQDIQRIMRKNESLTFVIADDTFVKNPVLEVKLKKRLLY